MPREKNLYPALPAVPSIHLLHSEVIETSCKISVIKCIDSNEYELMIQTDKPGMGLDFIGNLIFNFESPPILKIPGFDGAKFEINSKGILRIENFKTSGKLHLDLDIDCELSSVVVGSCKIRTKHFRNKASFNINGELSLISGDIWNDKACIYAKSYKIESCGNFLNQSGYLVAEEGGSLKVHGDIINRAGCILARKNDLMIQSLAGKIKNRNGGIILAEAGKVLITETSRIHTDESSLIHGQQGTYIQAQDRITQESVISGNGVSLLSKHIDLKAGILSDDQGLYLQQFNSKKLTLCNPLLSQGLMTVTAPHLETAIGLKSKNLLLLSERLSIQEHLHVNGNLLGIGSESLHIGSLSKRVEISSGTLVKKESSNRIFEKGNISLEGGTIDLINGLFSITGDISIKSTNGVNLGRQPKTGEIASGLACGGAFNIESQSSITFNGVRLHGQEKLYFKAMKEVDNISGHLSTKGDALVDAPLMKHRLLESITLGGHSTPIQFGHHYKKIHKIHLAYSTKISSKTALTGPAMMDIGGKLITTGETEILGSQLLFGEMQGKSPKIESFVPYEEFTTDILSGDKRIKKSTWAKTPGKTNGTPIEAICSAKKNLILDEPSQITGIISGPSILLQHIRNASLGKFDRLTRLPKARNFKQSIPLKDNPNPLYTTPKSLDLMNALMKVQDFPPLIILQSDETLIKNQENLSRLYPVVQEMEILIKALMGELGRGYLDLDTTEPEQIFFKLLSNAELFLNNGNSSQKNWLKDIRSPMLVYQIQEENGSKKLTPCLLLPLCWDNPKLRSFAGGLFSEKDITLKGNSQADSTLAIHCHIEAKGTVHYSHFKSVKHERRSYEEERLVIDKHKKTSWFVSRTKTFRKSITERSAEPGNSISGEKILFENIGELILHSAQLEAGIGGIQSDNIGNVIETAFVSVRSESVRSGKSNGIFGSQSLFHKALHSFTPTTMNSMGEINFKAASMTLHSLVADAIKNVHVKTTVGPLKLEVTKAKDDITPVHKKRGLCITKTTGQEEIGITTQFHSAEGSVVLESCDKLQGVSPQISAPQGTMKLHGEKGTEVSALVLSREETTSREGFEGLAYTRSKAKIHQETGIFPLFHGDKGIKVSSSDGDIVLMAPVFLTQGQVEITSEKGKVFIKPVELHHDISSKALGVGLSFFASKTVEAAMQGDFKKAAHHLLREFPILASVEDLMKSKDDANRIGNGLKTLYHTYRTYKGFAESSNLSNFAQNQIDQIQVHPKIRLGTEVSKRQEIDLALPWIQARNIILKGKNIQAKGMQVQAETLVAIAEEDVDLNAAEKEARSYCKSKGVTLGLNFTTEIPSLGADYANAESQFCEYIQSKLNISKYVAMSGKNISLKGVCIETLKAVLSAETLHLETLKNSFKSKNTAFSFSTEGQISVALGEQTSSWAKEQSAIRAKEGLIVNIRNQISLMGGVLAVEVGAPTLSARLPDGSDCQFYEMELPLEDKEALLHQFNLCGDKVKQQLLNPSLDPAIRNWVLDEIVSVYLSNNLPTSIFLEEDEALEKESVKLLSSTDFFNDCIPYYAKLRKHVDKIYAAYIQYVIGNNRFIFPEFGKTTFLNGLLDSILKLNDLNIQIFETDAADNILKLKHSFEASQNARLIQFRYDPNAKRYSRLTTKPGSIVAPKIEHRDVVSVDKGHQSSIGLDLSGALGQFAGMQSEFHGTVEPEHRSHHKEKLSKATISEAAEIVTQSDTSTMNRNSKQTEKDTKNRSFHGHIFTPLDNPISVVQKMKEGFSQPIQMFKETEPEKEKPYDLILREKSQKSDFDGDEVETYVDIAEETQIHEVLDLTKESNSDEVGFIREMYRELGRLKMKRDAHIDEVGEEIGTPFAYWAAQDPERLRKVAAVFNALEKGVTQIGGGIGWCYDKAILGFNYLKNTKTGQRLIESDLGRALIKESSRTIENSITFWNGLSEEDRQASLLIMEILPAGYIGKIQGLKQTSTISKATPKLKPKQIISKTTKATVAGVGLVASGVAVASENGENANDNSAVIGALAIGFGTGLFFMQKGRVSELAWKFDSSSNTSFRAPKIEKNKISTFYQFKQTTVSDLAEKNPSLKPFINKAQMGDGKPRAQSLSDSLRYKAELSFKEAGFLDKHGKLTAKALEKNRLIKEGKKLSNHSVIAELTKDGNDINDWGKYSTSSIELRNGQRKQIHYYYNKKTKEINYSHIDFKIKNPIKPFEIMRVIDDRVKILGDKI